MTYTYHYDSPLGGITLSSNGTELTGLWFDGQKYFGDTLPKEYEEKPLPIFEQSVHWLDIYFSGKAPDFTPSLCMQTTPFRKSVWEIMLTIPFGKTMTYGEIADRIAKQKGLSKMSAQAVGGAVGHNSISLIIPCHRVVSTNVTSRISRRFLSAPSSRNSASPKNTIQNRCCIVSSGIANTFAIADVFRLMTE